MRHPAFLRTPDRHRHGARNAILAATLGLGMIIAPAASAQDATPASSPVASPAAQAEASVETTTLVEAAFDEFVPAPLTMRLLRITLEPGASTPMHTHPGPEFDLVESGELTIRTEGDATITRASGETEAATAESQVLAAEDAIVYQPETRMYYENATEEPVVLLSAVILPVGADFPSTITYTEGQPTSQDFEGVSFVVLGDGLVQQTPGGAAVVELERMLVPAGVDLPASDGVTLYSQVEGNFSFIVDAGAVQVTRSEQQSLQPNAVLGEEFILEEGDAAFFPGGVSATSRADESGDLELLAIRVTYDEGLGLDPANLTFTSGIGTTGDATGGADTPDITGDGTAAAGITVVTNAENVNMRDEPTTAGNVVDQLAQGVELEVLGGPVEADEYTWYEVQVTADGGASGWIVAEFLDGLDALDEEATTETDAATETDTDTGTDTETDADTDTATDATTGGGSFATGDVVITTEENVRIRSEGSLAGDIVNAFPAGTSFEVTGDPVDADGYTWYPVALVGDDSITGWMPADFIAPE